MQNKKTIKKVLDELAKENPDLSYIRGMLEVLVDEEETAPIKFGSITAVENINRAKPPQMIELDEGELMDRSTAAALAKLKPSE